MKLIQQFLIASTVVVSFSAFASSQLTLEPVYGLETRLVRYPEPSRYVTSAVVGGRALYGSKFLAGEAEYTTTKSRNDYPSQNQKVEDTLQRFSLGLRTTLPVTQFLSAYLRGGARGTQGSTFITTNGAETKKDNPFRIDPYAGAGVQFHLHSMLSVNAGATLVRNAENKYDTQYTLGLSANFGNR